ncbi:hypothetical protein GCM10009851_24190 [Herbiconiux moechotypicola]|uniref:HNH nuclease domain-containing protein n=2 Tax=Herbiconiux moechotypicola TaxID=637393 RepID=A0ABN3DQ98_9MICO
MALPSHRFDDRARRLREVAHPESIVTRSAAAREERNVVLLPELDGMATLRHLLPAVDALAIDDLVDRIARSHRADDDPRTHAQRRSDALADIVLGRGERPTFAPTVLVTVPATTVAGADAAPGELHGYGPIDADTARSIAAAAPTFLRVLTGPGTGEPLVVTRHRHPAAPVSGGPAGRERYSASTALRTVLMAADETCRFPGCSRRAGRCELDHTHAWSEGGTTVAGNLAHLCSRHHHLKHEGGWRVAADPSASRKLTWTSPRGRHYTTHPMGLARHPAPSGAPPSDGSAAPPPPDSAAPPETPAVLRHHTAPTHDTANTPSRSTRTTRDEPPPF